jgi:hypothetical protein
VRQHNVEIGKENRKFLQDGKRVQALILRIYPSPTLIVVHRIFRQM